MKNLLDDSPYIFETEEKKENSTKPNKDKSERETKISDLNLGSEYFNINEDNESKNIEDNVISSSITSGEEENFNFYNVPKTNIINYMTPIKVNNNNKSNKKKKEIDNKNKNKTSNEMTNDLFSISNSSPEDKKVMISELDIELSNTSKNNFLTEYKSDKNNNIDMVKNRENEFKKQIEQNLKKFIKLNQENLNNNKIKNNIDKNKLNIKMKLKKYSQNINYCFTDISHKLNLYNKKNNKSTINSNNLGSFISIKNKHNENKIKNNNSFKTRKINTTKNNINKKLNGLMKINLDKKVKNNHKQNEFKSKIFYLQNKTFNNKILKTNELSDYLNSQRINYNFNTNNLNHDNKKVRSEYFSISEKKRNIINRQDKKNLTSLMKKTNSNLNEKNIIIQNFNCIDYNNINININNNNIIDSHKLSHRRNIDKTNIFNNNAKKNMTSIRNNIFFKKEKTKPNKIYFFYKSYIKNFYKNTGVNNNPKKGNEKKLNFLENNLDIKNKTFNYCLNKKNGNIKFKEKNKNNKNKIQNKLHIKVNDNEPELKKYSNTIITNTIRMAKQNTFKNINKSSFEKLLMSKKY